MKPINITPLKVLIVDDETDACENLETIFREHLAESSIHITGIAHNTAEAEGFISQECPDVVFLDIEMPGENAFQFLERVTPVDFEIVFVTAYDDYAVKAFKLNAVDYILKPLCIDEVNNAVTRAAARKKTKQLLSENNNFYHQLNNNFATRKHIDKIVLREHNHVDLVAFKDICFVEAQGSYSKFYFLKDDQIVSKIMSNYIAEYETLFPADFFYRVHKSYLVNCNYIKQILKTDGIYLLLQKNLKIPVSRRRYPFMIDFLKTNHFFAEPVEI